MGGDEPIWSGYDFGRRASKARRYVVARILALVRLLAHNSTPWRFSWPSTALKVISSGNTASLVQPIMAAQGSGKASHLNSPQNGVATGMVATVNILPAGQAKCFLGLM
jgi:hypothetical protein